MSYSSNGTPEARSSSSPARRFDRRDSTPIIRDEVVALNNAALHGVGPKDAGLASGVENTFLQLGGSLGLSVLVTLALRHAANRVGHGVSAAVATTDGYRFALRTCVNLDRVLEASHASLESW